MKKLLLFFCFTSFILAQSEVYFTSNTAPSPDGNNIVFSYNGDLWTVPVEGGMALRITAMDGDESNPVYSPDGKWISFTGTQAGNSDVYIIPVEGGMIKQLTFNDAADFVSSWSWDSKYIFFGSTRYNAITSYKISVEGGTPVRIFNGYKNRQHNLVQHPVTGEYLFNESFESYRFATRKGYKGDNNPDIKSYNLKTGEYKQYTTYRGKDMWPTVDKSGNIFFASDELNDVYNLYKIENGKSKSLTNFNSAIANPKVSSKGNIVVFEKDYQLYKYDTATGKSGKIEITLYENNPLILEKEFKTSAEVTNIDVSPDGKKIVFVSRGVLFVSDVKGKYVKEIITEPTERVLEVFWLKDSETILYSRTVKGWLNIFTIKVNDEKLEKQLTTEEQNNQAIQFNSDRTKAVYLSGRNELRVIDLNTFKNETVARDEFWAIYTTTPSFSPDDKFITYTAYRNFEQDIFVYDIEKKVSSHITKTGMTETNPFWSPDGKYIYFNSDRFQVNYPSGEKDSEIFRVALQKYDKEYKLSKFEKLFAKDEKKDTTKPVVKIDFNDLNDRWEDLVTHPSNQNLIYVTQKDDETTLLYTSNHDNEGIALWKTVLKPFDKPEHKKITPVSEDNVQIKEVKGNYYLLTNKKIYELNLTTNKAEQIAPEFSFEKNLNNEFNQMFYEAWANLSENYYDDNFHGADWEKIKEHYGSYLPYVRTRADLRRLFTDMLGELNSSHLGFTSNGSEEETNTTYKTWQTGIVFDNENPFVIDHILKDSPADKEEIGLLPGDKLVTVNGVDIDTKVNREYYFSCPFSDDEVRLTFVRKGKKLEVNVHPYNRAALQVSYYNEWVNQRQQMVEEKSDKKIAYIHMQDMGDDVLKQFLIEMSNEWHYRDALILDLRYNYGGNVHDRVLQFLSQRSYTQWKYRGGEMTPQPNFVPADKPIVLLINEQSLSDAEMTTAGFKALKLGTVVGTETYRWLIFTSGKRLVDGSFYRLPSWGCYTIDGKDIETNGAAPDIYVRNTAKDRHEGNDPQLDKAIEIIMKDLGNRK